ncbi:MAG: hypothetical protein ABFS32_00850 [Bacteroidota bacterium]
MDLKKTFLTLLFLATYLVVFAQQEEEEELPSYQTMYDSPFDIRNIYLHFQPLSGDIGALNVTGGFGLKAEYYHKTFFNASVSYKTSYGKRFDINRDAAVRNAINSDDEFPMHYNIEFGGTYHIQDLMRSTSTSKVLLYSKQLKGASWAATIPRHAEVSSNVRNIIGARLGGMLYRTVVNVDAALNSQEIELFYDDGTPIIDESIYSNLNAFVIYIGGSYSWIHNFAIEFSERWDPTGDDMIVTPYFDFLFAPSVKLMDVTLSNGVVSTEPIEKLKVGARTGVDVKFNRKLSWGYGLETGFRPGLKTKGFYLAFKMSFPLVGTNSEDVQKVFKDKFNWKHRK